MTALPGERRAAVTIVDSAYAALACVWARSLAEHDPAWDIYVLWLDAAEQPEGSEADWFGTAPVRVLRPSDLPMSSARFDIMRLVYDVKELATAVKPWALAGLLDRDYDVVAYMDPDLFICGPLAQHLTADVIGPAYLTPHVLHPLPYDDEILSYAHLRQAGVYNLGFLACTRQSRPLLAWWADRCMFDAIDSPAEWLFTDQLWGDFMPALFGARTWTNPGANIAYWNVHERSLRRLEDGRLVLSDGTPVLFVHFSGFLGAGPGRLTTHWGVPGRWDAHLAEHPQPALTQLSREYRALLTEARADAPAPTVSALSFVADATRVPAHVRRQLRAHLKQVEGRRLRVEPPTLDAERWDGPMVGPDGRPLLLRVAVTVEPDGELLASLRAASAPLRTFASAAKPKVLQPLRSARHAARRARRAKDVRWASPDYGYWRTVEVRLVRQGGLHASPQDETEIATGTEAN